MNIFTYDSYKKLLILLKESGKIYRFNDEIGERGILLRHDIDFDINKAFILSQIEKEKEVKSTYFVLTTSEFYNVTSIQNRSLLQKMNNNGFEIGLHFDCMAYGEISIAEMMKKIRYESAILEDIIGKRIASISLHTPSINNRFPIFKGYNNAYSKKYFNPEYYISDSCMNFRGKNIFEFINKTEEGLIQVLLHPIHFTQDGSNYLTIFKNLFARKISKFDNELRLLNETYKKEIGENCLLNIINGK